ncbi:MAG: GNAT family N-acetyltransferase [Lachnospiraceae bacterium]|nr:GNAT family N-acetyltransferase [Lachnospiraceae bacterium]
MIRLKNVDLEEKDLLWNINQKYMYEMSDIYLDELGEDGNYSYEYFDEYFKDPTRNAYFIYNDDTLVGFALLCPYSCMDLNPDYTMAEFTIFPAFRRKNYAKEAVNMIISKHPGKWEIRYHNNNERGKILWNKIAEPYNPQILKFGDEGTVLLFETK